VFRDIPLKNWASHPADAFQCLSGAWRDLAMPKAPPPPPKQFVVNAPPDTGAIQATFNDIAGPLGQRRKEEERI
jgi:hypothetical protein